MGHLSLRVCIKGGLLLAACPFLFSAPPSQRPTRPSARPAPSTLHSAPAPSPAAAEHEARPAPRQAKDSKASDTGTRPGKLFPFSELCTSLKLRLKWTAEDRQFELTGPFAKLEFEVDSRECQINGERVFLGEAVRMHKGAPHLSQTDAQKFIIPMIRPGLGAPSIPKLKVIMLDPGHGGVDAGKINTKLSVNEKTLTLDTALRAQKLLEAAGYKVVLTRRDDRFIELADRPELAARANANLFISIHFNSVESKAESVTGVEVFMLAPQWQLSSDQKPDPVYAPLRNPGNEQDHWNTSIGSCLHKALLDELKVSDRGMKRSRFAVLRLAPCPAVLIEAGYLSNDGEARRIASPQYRQKIAEAIAAGVDKYSDGLEAARRDRH